MHLCSADAYFYAHASAIWLCNGNGLGDVNALNFLKNNEASRFEAILTKNAEKRLLAKHPAQRNIHP